MSVVSPDVVSEAGNVASIQSRTVIHAADLPHVLAHYPQLKILSLDCFDTLIWRQTGSPRDVFYAMQQLPLFKSLGVTAYQRINAAQLAYRQQFIAHGNQEIKLSDIYKYFPHLSVQQQHDLAEQELQTEIDLCCAFPPFVTLIRQAIAQGLRIQVVSDTYFTSEQLRRILNKCLPADVSAAISQVYCSSEYGQSKSTGLFNTILQAANITAREILHIGDHETADFHAPKQTGLHALHFIQYPKMISELLKMHAIASALSILGEPSGDNTHKPNYNPFRGLFSLANVSDKPANIIGYLAFGPIFYAFARFINDEIATLKAAGKKPKVFFLLRDGHLLEQACKTYAGEALGKRIRIRKFVVVAASFRTQADIDFYLIGLAPQYYNFYVICEQLLLPMEITQQIIQLTNASPNPQITFNQLIHQPNIMQFVFAQSAAYRERLKKYIQNEMNLEAGDTVVLVDVGYIGVTQKHLIRALGEELNVEILGRYLIASHEPDRPDCKALFTSTACDHGLLEQSCTLKEGCVLDYDANGNPIYDKVKLSDNQYEKVQEIQNECLRFIADAKKFYAETNIPFHILQEYAFAAFRRHVYLPVAAELNYFHSFQHDKDMGPNKTKTMFNLADSKLALKYNSTAFHLHPYELRAANLEASLSAMLDRAFHFNLAAEDMQVNHDTLKLIIIRGNATAEMEAKIVATHDGYFTFCVPAVNHAKIAILFGQKFQWLQIDSINLSGIGHVNPDEINKSMSLQEIVNRSGDLYECLSTNSLLLISPIFSANSQPIYQITFRPLVRR